MIDDPRVRAALKELENWFDLSALYRPDQMVEAMLKAADEAAQNCDPHQFTRPATHAKYPQKLAKSGR